LDAFCGLAPSSSVEVIPAILPKSNKKGPWVRCISNIPGRNNMDVGNVDSIDKVYRVLTKHLQVKVRFVRKKERRSELLFCSLILILFSKLRMFAATRVTV
jgi:hypothetical protein